MFQMLANQMSNKEELTVLSREQDLSENFPGAHSAAHVAGLHEAGQELH